MLRLKLSSLAIVILISLVLLPHSQVSALSGSDFQASKIIDDSLFFDANGLSLGDIQTFLNAKVTVCDTNGTQPYSGTTHAAYGTARGYPPPYTCLKDFRQDTTAKPTETGLCQGYSQANQSAAEIIYGVAKSCGINPKVLIVLLQKEQGLVTDEWPWSIQYRSATGYGCPDTAPCDSEYYGFFNQVYAAARQFKRYAQYPNNYNYVAYRNNYVQFNPSASCGGSNIFIQNQATAGLYNYTPYQPNQAALNNLYGNGDGCSAYGNRNFWRYYNDWFGSTNDLFDNVNIRLSSPLTINPSKDLYQNQTYAASFQITNSANYAIDIGTPIVSVRGPGGQNLDVPGDSVTIPANSTYTYNKQWSTPMTGWHQFNLVLYKPGIGYSLAAPAGITPDISRQVWVDVRPNPGISSGLTIVPAQPAAGQLYTASFSVRNSAPYAVNIGKPFVIVRGPQGQNLDVPIAESDIIINPNSSYTYSKQWLSTVPGNNTFSIAFYYTGKGIITTEPKSDVSSIVRSLTINVLDNPALSTSLNLPSEIIAGVPYTASYSVVNNSAASVNIGSPFIVVRGPQGQNRDVPMDNSVNIAAGSTYTYNKQWITPDPGWHEFTIVVYKPGEGFSYTKPTSLSPAIVRQVWINVKPNPRVVSNLTITPSTPKVGQNYTISYSIRNDSSQAIDIGSPFIVVRGPQGQNRDVPIGEKVVVSPNSTYIYSKEWFVTNPGLHTFSIATWSSTRGLLVDYPPADVGILRSANALVAN